MKPKHEDPNLVDTKPRKPKGLSEALDKAEPALNKGDSAPFDPSALTVPVSLVAPPPAPAPETQTMEVFPPSTPAPLPTKTPSPMPTPPRTPPSLPEIQPTPRAISLSQMSREMPMVRSTPPVTESVQPMTPVEPPRKIDDSGKIATADLAAPAHSGDTGQMSIWEVFGVVPPSERTRSDLQQIINELTTPPEANNGGFPAESRSQNTVAGRHFPARRAKPPVRPRAVHTTRAKARLRARAKVNIR